MNGHLLALAHVFDVGVALVAELFKRKAPVHQDACSQLTFTTITKAVVKRKVKGF
jgi:hypothetical protein